MSKANAIEYGYFINLDERGEFYADVRHPNETTVYEIHGFDIVEDGFMRDTHDMSGLTDYLRNLEVIGQYDTITLAN